MLEADQLASALKTTPDVIADLRGTMQADNAQELKALADLDPDTRRRAVAAIRGGEAKTVRDARVAIGLDKKVEHDPQLSWLTTISDIWLNKLDRAHKKKFLADNGLTEAQK